MITIEINLDDKVRKIELRDEILFNSLLCQNEALIKKLIRIAHPLYKIRNPFFTVVNKFVDVDENGNSLYGGLIVRTSFEEFAVLYLEDSLLDDDYIVSLIEAFLRDIGEKMSHTVTINKIELDKITFFKAMK